MPRRRAKRPAPDEPQRVVTYRRSATGADPRAYAAARGWPIVAEFSDTSDSMNFTDRSGGAAAFAMLDAGTADVLVAPELTQIAESIMDFTALADLAESRGWAIAAPEFGVVTTNAGRFGASVYLAAFEYRRNLEAERG